MFSRWQKNILFALMFVAAISLGALGYSVFLKTEVPEIPKQETPCGNGVCDPLEQRKSDLCPRDCETKNEKPTEEKPAKQPLYFFYAIHVHTATGDGLKDEKTYKLNAETTRAIAEVLTRHGTKGTFQPVYGVAEGAAKYEGQDNLFKQLAAQGHEVGIHVHRNSDITKAYDAVVSTGITPRTVSGLLAETSQGVKFGGESYQASFSEGLKIAAELGMDITTENLNPSDPKNPFSRECPEIGTGNIEWKDTHNLMHPWKMDYVNKNICRNNDDAKILALDHASIVDIFTGGAPDVLNSKNFDKLKPYFQAAVSNVKSDKINMWGFVTHIKEYSKGEDAVPEKEALDALDAFLTFVDASVKTGKVKYATASEIADAYADFSTSQESTKQGPINIAFTMHFDPLGDYQGGGDSSQKDYEEQRDNLRWLSDYLSGLKKNNEGLSPHVNLEFGGDQAEYYLADSEGLSLLKDLYKTGDHAFGVHFHDAKRLSEGKWESTAMKSEEDIGAVFESHVPLGDELIGKIIGSVNASDIRKASRIVTGWIPREFYYNYAYKKYGFTLETGGRTEGFHAFFDHDVFQPFSVSDGEFPLQEDLDGKVLVIGDMPNLGAIESHANKFQDSSVAAVKRKFLQIYVERWWQGQIGGDPKVWTFGWSEHPANLYAEGAYRANRAWHYHRDEVSDMVSWLNENFVEKRDADGGMIARYANAAEVSEEFEKWKNGRSSFDYPSARFSWDSYPYSLKALAKELALTHYVRDVNTFLKEGVRAYELSRCESGKWQIDAVSGEISCGGQLRTMYLLWNEGDPTSLDFSAVIPGEVQVIFGASGKKEVGSSSALRVENEPIIVIAA